MPRRLRGLAGIVPALGLVAVGLANAVPADAAPPGGAVRYQPSAKDAYVNFSPPAVEDDTSPGKEKVGPTVRRNNVPLATKIDHKFASGNPAAARELARREDKALRTGRNPADFIFKKAGSTKTAKLLTVLVEFNDQANDDFSGFSHPKTIDDVNDCVTEPVGTKLNGPSHNTIPDPSKLAGGGKDNYTMWVPDFNTAHFTNILYTSKGITTRVRQDLTDPRDGRKGIDISGGTMKNMYEEMSKGAYSISGTATDWIKVPHSEAWYGAAKCGTIPQDMSGHPDNPRGYAQLPVDVVNTLAAQNPSFPWADYDIEDVSDADADGNVDEPDGVIDHLVLVHAGKDKSSRGGAEGTFAIWAHSAAVAGGHAIPGTNLKISNYIVQPEDAGVGVFAHEYGHDLGLPDLYDTSGAGASDIDFWDLMSSGSHSGPIFQSMPTHMGLWDKWVLGWASPKTVNPGDAAKLVTIGQASRTPKHTEDGLRINLPAKEVVLSTPHSGANLWWSNSDQTFADTRLTRTLEVPSGADEKLRWWSDWSIEQDWDYGFLEVSTDGGTTWAEQKVFRADGTPVTTPDDYADPNKRLAAAGNKEARNKKYGITGESGGWQQLHADLTPFAGTTVQVRLRYVTDEAFNARGWFSDDFSLTDGAATVWSDDVEGGAAGWTASTGTMADTSGAGFVIHSGQLRAEQYYLAEWRNHDGFDKGLRYAYDTTYSRDGAWKVEHVPYNAPGLLLWYRDAARTTNIVAGTTLDLPSAGPKGQLLIVDSHFDPLRRTGAAAEKDPSVLKNMASRAQSSNAAFTFGGTYRFKECIEGEPFTEFCTEVAAQPGVKTFTDARGWYPGLELRNGEFLFRDRDASVTIPSGGGAPYTTRVVNPDGSPATQLYGTNVGGMVLGSGNPGDENKNLGVQLKLISPLPGNLGAVVKVTPPKEVRT